MSEELRELLWYIVSNYTFGQQREIFVEKCAEAIQAAQKLKRANGTADYEKAISHLREEVADVLIMAEQMRYFLGEEKVDGIIKSKLERQIERIKEEV
ncbi:MAG: hypothetical protein J6K17_00075 [Oscillospiraceae bacterium]|nr:hypothetical protein [Oscillospiraceae bacterium]